MYTAINGMDFGRISCHAMASEIYSWRIEHHGMLAFRFFDIFCFEDRTRHKQSRGMPARLHFGHDCRFDSTRVWAT